MMQRVLPQSPSVSSRGKSARSYLQSSGVFRAAGANQRPFSLLRANSRPKNARRMREGRDAAPSFCSWDIRMLFPSLRALATVVRLTGSYDFPCRSNLPPKLLTVFSVGLLSLEDGVSGIACLLDGVCQNMAQVFHAIAFQRRAGHDEGIAGIAELTT